MSNDKLAQATRKLLNAVYFDWPNSPAVRSAVLDAAREVQAALNAAEAEKQAGPVASEKEDAELFRWLLIANDWGICEWDEREAEWVRDSRSESVVRDGAGVWANSCMGVMVEAPIPS